MQNSTNASEKSLITLYTSIHRFYISWVPKSDEMREMSTSHHFVMTNALPFVQLGAIEKTLVLFFISL